MKRLRGLKWIIAALLGVSMNGVSQRAEGADAAQQEAAHLKNIKQVTNGFPRAGEGYFSADGQNIVYQAYPLGYPFYQIYTQKLEGGTPLRLSPEIGRAHV